MNQPPHSQYPILSTEEIILRKISIADIPEIMEISFYDGKQAETLIQGLEMQEKINQDYFNGNSIHWGIFNKSTNKIMGTCGYYRGFENGKGELGCVLLPQFYRKGIMTKALKLAIDFGFDKVELDRIIAITTKQNVRAIKLLTRLNFIKVGDLPNDAIEFELKKINL